jgi:hypothetical protein
VGIGDSLETHGNSWKPGFHQSLLFTSFKIAASVQRHPPVAFWAFMAGALAKPEGMGSGPATEKQALRASDISMLSALGF